MIAAAESLGNRDLMADALRSQSTEITDDGDLITIRVESQSRRLAFIPLNLLNGILWKLNLQRRVDVQVRPAASVCRMPPEAVAAN